MRRFIEVVSNIILILIVALAGSAIGYYSAGYAPKREAPAEVRAPVEVRAEARRETNGVQAMADPLRVALNPLAEAMPAMPPPALKPVALVPAERTESDQRAEAARHMSRVQSRYNSCLQQAELTFTNNWDETCKSSEDERRKSYQQCLKTVGASKAKCSQAYTAIPEKNCKLPPKVTSGLGTKLQMSAHRCLLEMQAGLE